MSLNAQQQDIKRTALLFQTGAVELKQHISDLEIQYIHNLIVNPGREASIASAWQQYWSEVGIPEDPQHFNDRAMVWLASIGFTAEDYNARWTEYWTSLLP